MLIRSLIPALLLALGVAAGARAQVNPGPFTDVPAGHPLYAVVHYLDQRGLFTGYPEGAFAGRKIVTRYEFAVAAQRMVSDVPRVLREGKPVPSQGQKQEQLRDALSTPEKRRQLVVWFSGLVREVRPELRMLGTDTAKLEQQLAKLLAAETVEATPEMGAPPNLSRDEGKRLFGDVPKEHPAYPALRYLTHALDLPHLYPRGCFGKSSITRYEFAAHAQLVIRECSEWAGPSPPQPTPHRSVAIAQATFRDPHRIRTMGTWLETLCTEFQMELDMLTRNDRPLDWQKTTRELQERSLSIAFRLSKDQP